MEVERRENSLERGGVAFITVLPAASPVELEKQEVSVMRPGELALKQEECLFLVFCLFLDWLLSLENLFLITIVSESQVWRYLGKVIQVQDLILSTSRNSILVSLLESN